MNHQLKEMKQQILNESSKIREYISFLEKISHELSVDIEDDKIYISAKAYKKAVDNLISKTIR